MRPYFAFFDRIRGFKKGLLAQLVEQWTLNPTVASSILARPTILRRQMAQSRRIERGGAIFSSPCRLFYVPLRVASRRQSICGERPVCSLRCAPYLKDSSNIEQAL